LNKSKIALNGRLLLRKPKLYHSCSAEEEECFMKVEEFEVCSLYQSGRSDVTNLYSYHGENGRK
jgi:hypothetical protein